MILPRILRKYSRVCVCVLGHWKAFVGRRGCVGAEMYTVYRLGSTAWEPFGRPLPFSVVYSLLYTTVYSPRLVTIAREHDVLDAPF